MLRVGKDNAGFAVRRRVLNVFCFWGGGNGLYVLPPSEDEPVDIVACLRIDVGFAMEFGVCGFPEGEHALQEDAPRGLASSRLELGF